MAFSFLRHVFPFATLGSENGSDQEKFETPTPSPARSKAHVVLETVGSHASGHPRGGKGNVMMKKRARSVEKVANLSKKRVAESGLGVRVKLEDDGEVEEGAGHEIKEEGNHEDVDLDWSLNEKGKSAAVGAVKSEPDASEKEAVAPHSHFKVTSNSSSSLPPTPCTPKNPAPAYDLTPSTPPLTITKKKDNFLTNETYNQLSRPEIEDFISTWSEAEQELYVRIAWRGFEAVFPMWLGIEFRTFPKDLFEVEDLDGEKGNAEVKEKMAYLQVFKGDRFRTYKAFNTLLTLGLSIRTVLTSPSARPWLNIHRAIKRHIKWVLDDASLWTCEPSSKTAISRPERTIDHVPAIWAITSCDGMGENSTGIALENMEERLRKRALYYARKGGLCPVLYGFVIIDAHVIIFTLDTAGVILSTKPSEVSQSEETETASWLVEGEGENAVDEDGVLYYPEPNVQAHLNFTLAGGQDIWNGIAVLMAVERLKRSYGEVVSDWREN